MATSSGGTGKAARAYLWIIAVAVLLAVGLSAAWYYLASQLDTRAARTIEMARAEGTEIDCTNREVFGYPFRLGLRCDAVTVEATRDGVRATAGALRTAAQIYRPNRIVAELDAPLIVDTAETPPLEFRWDLAQASAAFWTDGLDRAALAVEAPVVALTQPAAGRLPLVEAGRFEVHLRRREADLDFALSSRDTRIVAPQLAGVPAYASDIDLTILGAADWLGGGAAGRTPGELLAGRQGKLRSFSIDFGDAQVDLSGTFAVGADGLVSGDFALAVQDPARIAAMVGEAAPQLGSAAQTIATALSFAGRTENGRSVIDLAIRDGNVAAGVIPLGRIPPLR
ncbi:DUF2125 domain-containing protein [Aurantimonas sp. A2-1-M11]|uniref:DUF2125 domain-containing protein n=1 Tax=Aurantimonas sp. A2-1-M11 TaxID=3113712 RepID=UPI002F923233